MRRATLVLVLVTAGCGRVWDVVGPSTDLESFVLAETERLAALDGVRVHGQITTETWSITSESAGLDCSKSDPCHAASWYKGSYGRMAVGTVYYYQADVLKQSMADLTWNAAHEVAHALVGPDHGERWSSCRANLAAGVGCL